MELILRRFHRGSRCQQRCLVPAHTFQQSLPKDSLTVQSSRSSSTNPRCLYWTLILAVSAHMVGSLMTEKGRLLLGQMAEACNPSHVGS